MLKLAQNPDHLSAIRGNPEKPRLQTPLFDIACFSENIESAYRPKWRICREKESPPAFTVAEDARLPLSSPS